MAAPERGTVTCWTVDGRVDAPAWLTANLAVHKSLVSGKYNPRKAYDWTLTHRASGLAMNWYDRRTDAVAAAVKLESDCPADLAKIAKFVTGQMLRKGSPTGRRLKESLGR